MTPPRCQFILGNGRFVQISEWKWELIVEIREWESGYPTKTGVSLKVMQYKSFLARMDSTIDPALKNDQGNYQEATKDDSFFFFTPVAMFSSK